MTAIHVTPMQVDLKPLCGSVKQISWAEQIRATVVNHVAKHGNEVSIRRESYQAVLNILCTRLSAAWWIDRRGSICDLILSLKVWSGDVEIVTSDVERYIKIYRWTPGVDDSYCYRFTTGHLNRNDCYITPVGWADEISITANTEQT